MSWRDLLAIRDEARADVAANKAAPLVDCPRCGEPLDRRADGWANCPLGHYRIRATTKGEAGVA
jgi:hypothetical protein